jgi:hypothetical protein
MTSEHNPSEIPPVSEASRARQQRLVDRVFVPLGPPPCPRCGLTRRWAPAPGAYCGPASGSLIYQYAKLLEPDRRYTHRSHRVAMCDTCRYGEMFLGAQP